MILTTLPKSVGASAIYPHSRRLEEKFTFPSPFEDGEPIECFRVDESKNVIHLPRRVTGKVVPVTEFDDGLHADVELLPSFSPRSEEQGRVIDQVNTTLSKGESFICQAPTGFGKTVVGVAAISSIKRRTLVITTKEDIVEQWVDSLLKFSNLEKHEVGIWRGDRIPSIQHKVVVGLVQSISKGPSRYGEKAYKGFGLVICDEVHRMGAHSFSQSMWWLPAKLRLGLSATPYRKDGRDIVFKLHIGDVEVTANMEVMVPKVLMARSSWKVPRSSYGEPIKHSPGRTAHIVKFLANCLDRNLQIVKFLKACLAKDRNTIVFSDTLDHLKAIRDIGVTCGIPERAFGWYVGLSNYPVEDGPQKAKRAKQSREAAKYRPIILATYSMASEATDIPWLDACVLATPKADVVQIVGRIRREYEGKKTPVVYDIVDSSSPVFKNYAAKRLRWYQQLGCSIKNV